MAGASDYLENKILNLVCNGVAYTPPTIKVALFTSAATGLETGDLTGEISGGGYARQSITFNTSTAGSADNNATVQFPQATADWGTVHYMALVDASDNVLLWNTLTVDKEILNGDIFQFSAGDVIATMD